ncbi:MAG: tyrosine--tRNA ligase [Ilumatobacteraceae bacterium]|uniref:tyrosine--tRNA ligase n=1 Tax=freshwater metagenome TaxID=449393 RepID=A0A6J6N207_9ZZZZ|nr:tyrosine--tRNA ligase [Ilumatobacteraceae bacterium]MSY43513.1 tyrosine--tRNA ligase [Actinomycetota bacterium]
MTNPGLLGELSTRGLIHDSTDAAALEARLSTGPIGVYVGFDPTADSLHVGHLLGQLTLRRFQMAGHRPFPLAGGATGMVGDPSGKSEERNLLDADTLQHNVESIKKQLANLLDFSPGSNAATLVNNADWTANISALEFLRDVGKHITVNQMMAKESVKNRLNSENGLSYTEFSYMLLQANDFRHLCATHDVELQMGGSDQWGNITAGIDLIRKTLGRGAFGATWPLVTRSDGQKFGKTAGGAVWLDPQRTSPYQFRQFWMQMADADVVRYLPQFSLASLDDVRALIAEHEQAPEKRAAQRSLAAEMTSLVHGAEAAQNAEAAADILFGADPTSAAIDALRAVAAEVPTTAVSSTELDDPIALLVRAGVVTSNSDARRTIQQKGLKVNGQTLEEGETLANKGILHDRWVLVRKGKTSYHLFEVSA